VNDEWVAVCPYSRLEPERGVAAYVDGVQVAIFRTHDGGLHAIDNRDPFSGACVLSRGIVGNRGTTPTVASPMHKQVFDLTTGRCLDVPDVSVRTYGVRLRDGVVDLRRPAAG
jgi:nitrite reductase (NADH) small subunit